MGLSKQTCILFSRISTNEIVQMANDLGRARRSARTVVHQQQSQKGRQTKVQSGDLQDRSSHSPVAPEIRKSSLAASGARGATRPTSIPPFSHHLSPLNAFKLQLTRSPVRCEAGLFSKSAAGFMCGEKRE